MRFLEATCYFLLALGCCATIFSGIFVIGWLWFEGLLAVAGRFGTIAGFAYMFISCSIIPAIAITSTLMEEQ